MQVLRVSYEKNRRLKLMEIAKAAADNANPPEISGQSGLKLSAKKRTFVGLAASEPPHVQAYKRQRQLLLDASASSAVTRVPPYPRDYEEPAKDESHQLISDEKDEDEDDCEGTGPGETPANFVVALRPSRARRFSWSERLDRWVMHQSVQTSSAVCCWSFPDSDTTCCVQNFDRVLCEATSYVRC